MQLTTDTIGHIIEYLRTNWKDPKCPVCQNREISSRDPSSAWFLVAAVVSTALLVILRPLPVSASSIVEQAKYIDDEYVRESPAMIMYSVFSGGARQEAAAASESQEQS